MVPATHIATFGGRVKRLVLKCYNIIQKQEGTLIVVRKQNIIKCHNIFHNRIRKLTGMQCTAQEILLLVKSTKHNLHTMQPTGNKNKIQDQKLKQHLTYLNIIYQNYLVHASAKNISIQFSIGKTNMAEHKRIFFRIALYYEK